MSDTNREEIRLQKFLARAGVASRRNSETLISDGRVSVNGQVVTELGSKVKFSDEVRVDGVMVSAQQENVTLMLHKPAGYVSTMDDPQGRPCVKDLVDVQQFAGLYHIGRLDRDTSGLLLFSTDGKLGNALLHPSSEVFKTYYVMVEGVPSEEHLKQLRNGIKLDENVTAPAQVELLSGDKYNVGLQMIEGDCKKMASGHLQRHSGKASYNCAKQDASILRMVIHEGRNRQIRRMLDSVGHPVIALHRQSFATLDLGDLKRGKFRLLTQEEIDSLYAIALGTK